MTEEMSTVQEAKYLLTKVVDALNNPFGMRIMLEWELHRYYFTLHLSLINEEKKRDVAVSFSNEEVARKDGELITQKVARAERELRR